jgi:hypothetical protein
MRDQCDDQNIHGFSSSVIVFSMEEVTMKVLIAFLLLASGAASANGVVFCDGGLQFITNKPAAEQAHYVGEPFVLSLNVPADWFVQYNGGPIENLGLRPAGPVFVTPQATGLYVLRAFQVGAGYCTLSDTVLALPSVDSITAGGTLWTVSSITFSASVSNGAGAKTYLWNFGDGGTSTAVSPTHSYNTAGSFAVNLTVTDANGRQGSRQQVVAIADNPNVPGQVGPILSEFMGCSAYKASYGLEWTPGGSQPSNYFLYRIKPASPAFTTWTQYWLTSPRRIERGLLNQHYTVEISGCISNSVATCGPARSKLLTAQNCSGSAF